MTYQTLSSLSLIKIYNKRKTVTHLLPQGQKWAFKSQKRFEVLISTPKNTKSLQFDSIVRFYKIWYLTKTSGWRKNTDVLFGFGKQITDDK